MIVLDVLGYFNRNKQNSYAALKINFKKIEQMSMVPRARGTMDMGVGYNGHVNRHVVGTFCVNQPILLKVK